MVRGLKILQALFLISFVTSAQVTEKIEGITTCVDSITKNADTNTSYQSLKVRIGNKKIFFKDDKTSLVFKHEAVLSWINKVEKDSIRAFEIVGMDFMCYAISSQAKQATGLGANFTSWLVVIPKQNLVIDFESLAQSSKLIYFDRQTNKLMYVRFTYSESFFWNRDWDNVTFKMELNELDNGTSKIIGSKDSKCSGK